MGLEFIDKNNEFYLENRGIEKVCEFFRGDNHPILNKKVYFKGKIPSYYALIIWEIYIENRDIMDSFKREAKLDKYKVDIFIISKELKIYIVEIDIFPLYKGGKNLLAKMAVENSAT